MFRVFNWIKEVLYRQLGLGNWARKYIYQVSISLHNVLSESVNMYIQHLYSLQKPRKDIWQPRQCFPNLTNHGTLFVVYLRNSHPVGHFPEMSAAKNMSDGDHQFSQYMELFGPETPPVLVSNFLVTTRWGVLNMKTRTKNHHDPLQMQLQSISHATVAFYLKWL